MRYLYFVLFVFFIASCDDGDLQIETIDFDSNAVQFCADEPSGVDETVFFKINGDEALALTLQANLLANVTSVDGSISSSFPGASQLIYRLFSDNITLNYFCDDIPPITPTVLNEFSAEGGDLMITSTVSAVSESTKTYSHNITISNLSLTNDNNERLTDTSGLDFGAYTTTTDSSVALLFANYNDETAVACTTAPVTGQLRVYKLLNDEALVLDLPEELLLNEATATPRTADLLAQASLTNTILNTEITADLVCTNTFSDEILINQFVSTEGTISVTTVENAPDADGIVSYTHTITLTAFQLRDVNADLITTEIATYSFGTLTTFTN